MTNNRTYFEYITYKFEDLLKNNLYVIAKGPSEHSYELKESNYCSLIDQKRHLTTVDCFMEDLKSYLYNNTPLNFIYKNNVELYRCFSESLFGNIYRNNPFYKEKFDENSTFDRLLEVLEPSKKYANWEPTVEQLIKLVSLFKEGTVRIDSFFDELPRGVDSQGRSYTDFVLFLMTIPNKHLLENNPAIIRAVGAEISGFTQFFKAETDTKVKDALKIYLTHRVEEFEKINNTILEQSLFNRIKKAIAPKYWSELIFAFPTLRTDNSELIVSENLIEMPLDKIYHLNLNKAAFYKTCPSVLNERELIETFQLITKAIELNKPTEIDMLYHYSMKNDIKIIFSGHNIDESYLGKIGNLYEKMFFEYNSDNVIKFSNDLKKDEILSHNIEYLNKVAEMFWLEALLDNNISDNKKKKLKM
jgi:hypothetical protein